jgi:hypothetical protein
LRNLSQRELANFMIDPAGVVRAKRYKYGGRGYELPGLLECRGRWAELRWPIGWDRPSGDWSGDDDPSPF